MFQDNLALVKKMDPVIGDMIDLEFQRQNRNIELIASENIVSEAVMAAMGSVLGAGFMVIINVLINVLVPSGSGQASVSLPILVPLGDLWGLPADRLHRLSDRRRHLQHLYPHLRILYGRPGYGQNSLGQVGQVDSAFDWTPVPAGSGLCHDCAGHQSWALLSLV